MNPNWRSFLESTEAVFKDDSDEILNFGDASGELQAAGSRTILVPLTHLGLIEASGDDAKAFLHSQFTSDINHLGGDQVQHSAWCTAKGRMQASFLAWREADDFRLVVSGDLEAASLKRLQMFVLRSKVSCEFDRQSSIARAGRPAGRRGAGRRRSALPPGADDHDDRHPGSVIALEANRYIVAATGGIADAVAQAYAQGTSGRAASVALAGYTGRLPAGHRSHARRIRPADG